MLRYRFTDHDGRRRYLEVSDCKTDISAGEFVPFRHADSSILDAPVSIYLVSCAGVKPFYVEAPEHVVRRLYMHTGIKVEKCEVMDAPADFAHRLDAYRNWRAAEYKKYSHVTADKSAASVDVLTALHARDDNMFRAAFV